MTYTDNDREHTTKSCTIIIEKKHVFDTPEQ